MWMREGTAMRVSSTALAYYCFETEHAMEKLGLAGAVSFTLDMARDLIDARAHLAKLNGVQFATTEERLAVVAEVSAYLAGGDRG
jgi:hypothetical protein